MSEQTRVVSGAAVGALIGAAAVYLFFTEGGRVWRDRLEPATEELRREFGRFQRTVQKLGDMANEGIRVVNEFNAARTQSHFTSDRTSH